MLTIKINWSCLIILGDPIKWWLNQQKTNIQLYTYIGDFSFLFLFWLSRWVAQHYITKGSWASSILCWLWRKKIKSKDNKRWTTANNAVLKKGGFCTIINLMMEIALHERNRQCPCSWFFKVISPNRLDWRPDSLLAQNIVPFYFLFWKRFQTGYYSGRYEEELGGGVIFGTWPCVDPTAVGAKTGTGREGKQTFFCRFCSSLYMFRGIGHTCL